MTEILVLAAFHKDCPVCWGAGEIADPNSLNKATPDSWIECVMCAGSGWLPRTDVIGPWDESFDALQHALENLSHEDHVVKPRWSVPNRRWWRRTVHCLFGYHLICREAGSNNDRCPCYCHRAEHG